MAPAAPTIYEGNDAALLARFAESRDGRAFADLVRRHAGLIHSAALRRVGSADAADVTQAAFLVLLRKPDQALRAANRPGGLAAWMLAITRNLCNNAQRRRRRREHHEREAAVPGDDATIGGDPVEALAWREVAPLLDDAVLSLPAGDRAAILMKFYENRPATEIAAALDVSHDAARQRIARALKKLRRRLDAKGVAVPSALLATLLTARAVRAAPPDLTVACCALATGGTATAAAIALTKGTTSMMTPLLLKLAAATTAGGLTIAAGFGLRGTDDPATRPAANPPAEAKNATVSPKPVAVGDVIERTLRDDREGTQQIDLDTGRVFAGDVELAVEEANLIDAVPVLEGETVGLGSLRMTAQPVRNDLFDADPPPAQLVADLWRRQLSANVYLDALGGLPRTFAFRTHDGTGGLLQITALGDGDRPESITFRYKVLAKGEAAPTPKRTPQIQVGGVDVAAALTEEQQRRASLIRLALQTMLQRVIVEGEDWPADLKAARRIAGDDWPPGLPDTLAYARPERDPAAPVVGVLPVLFERTTFPDNASPVVLVGFDDGSAFPVRDAGELRRLLDLAGTVADE